MMDIVYPTIFCDDDNKVYLCTSKGLYITGDLGVTWDILLAGNDVGTIVKTSDGVMFISMNKDGVSRSYDNGTSWEQVNNGLTEKEVNSLVYARGQLFAGTEYAGVFTSFDNGDSWVTYNEGLFSTEINHLELNKDENEIIAATGNGLYKIEIPGNEWTQKNGGLMLSSLNDIAFDNNENIYVASEDLRNVVISADNWSSWNEADMGISYPSHLPPKLLEVEKHPSGMIFSAVEGYGIYRSANNGETWVPVNDYFGGYLWTKDLIINDDGVIMAVMYDGTGSVFSDVIFRSFDAGDSWEGFPYPSEDMLHGDIEYGANGKVYMITTDIFQTGNLLVSNDYGATWDIRNSNMYFTFDEMAYSGSDNSIYILQTAYIPGAIFVTSDEGISYTNLTENLCTTCRYEAIGIAPPGNKIFVKTDDVYISEDQGASWTLINDGLPSSNGIENYTARFFEHDNNGNTYLGTERYGLYRINTLTTTPQNAFEDNLFNIGPNPGNGIFLLDINTTFAKSSKMFIYGLNGNLVLKKDNIGNKGQEKLDLTKELRLIPILMC